MLLVATPLFTQAPPLRPVLQTTNSCKYDDWDFKQWLLQLQAMAEDMEKA